MIMEHLTRQLDLIPMDVLGEEITIIGAGAIGSWVTLSLAKMGFGNIRVYDHDTISIENMNCQFYPMNAIGESKVETLCNLVADFTNIDITPLNQKWFGERHNGIVISAVDCMDVRQSIFEAYRMKGYNTRAVIDGRMGAENALLYVYKPMNIESCHHYSKSLYSNEEAVAERCTAKATIYTANLLAGLVCKAVKDQLTTSTYLKSAQWDIKNNELLCFNMKQ
jgi:molybdopterin/thiamine biosynthesis adenylyltransferase